MIRGTEFSGEGIPSYYDTRPSRSIFSVSIFTCPKEVREQKKTLWRERFAGLAYVGASSGV